MKKIAIVGTGIMGSAIATNFLKHGYKVIIWNRHKEKIKQLVTKGAIEAFSVREATEKADIVFEVTANDESSRSVWLGDNGIIAGASPAKTLIICATVSIGWIDTLHELCKSKKLTFFDMAMTGGRAGAEAGKLILLVGGDKKRLKILSSDLKAISEKIMHFGPVGSGMRFKLLLNMLQAIHMIGFGEVLKIAKNGGLDMKTVGEALAEHPGGTTTKVAWRDFQREPNPINFSVRWITKDLTYAKKFADKIKTPLLDKALSRYQDAIAKDFGDKDWTSINKLS